MKKFKIILAICVGLVIIILSLSYVFFFWRSEKQVGANAAVLSSVKIVFPRTNFSIRAELAQTPTQWSRGLMYRTSMPADSGMLFLLTKEEVQSFWMKNTKIPLDIIFISSLSKIVDIKNNFLPCISDPCPVYNSAAPAQDVLEVNGGLAQKAGIKIGDVVIIKK
jgi:uncharacterized protein